MHAGFRDDWFALPERRFPYALALARGLDSDAARLGRARRRDPLAAWQVPELREALLATLARFVTTAEASGLKPVLAFIPQHAGQRDALRTLAEPYRKALGARARFAVVDGQTPDTWSWADYAAPGCHPSRGGYGIIAGHVARTLRSESDGRPGNPAE